MKKVIYCSFSATGNEDSVNYLKDNFDNFARIVLKFHHVNDKKPSKVISYFKGKVINEINLPTISVKGKKTIFLLLPVIYILHLFNIFYSIAKIKEKYDVFIGLNYFAAFGGVLLKKFKLINQTVYWAGDFYPIPPNGIYFYLVRIFIIIDKICIKHSDYVWFMNNRQFEIRKEKGYFDKMANNFCIVPSGVDEASMFSYPLKDVEVFSLVLLGVIGKAQGIDLVVESMPDIIENIPDFKLKIIGSGPYEKELKDKVKVMGLEGNVVFYGFVTSEEETRNIIGRSGSGVALYVPDPYACTRYADSGKAKVYLSCGVPVIITNVPYTALEINQFRAGVMINYTKKEFVRAVFEILNQGTETLLEFKSNAVRLAKQYSTKVLMSNIFLENRKN